MVNRCHICRIQYRFAPFEVRVKEESKKIAYYICSEKCLVEFAVRQAQIVEDVRFD